MKWPLFLVPAAMAFVPAVALGQTYTGPGGAIPDASPSIPLVSTINVTDNVVIQDLTISLEGFAHTWQGDLWARVTAPDGVTTIDLFRRAGQGGNPNTFGYSNNFVATSTYIYSDAGAGTTWFNTGDIAGGVYRPFTNAAANVTAINSPGTGTAAPVLESFASTFGGMAAQGAWTLSISDFGSGDIGSLAGWSMGITAVPEPSAAGLLGLGLLGLMRRRR